jgi:hypothetical protein
MQPLKRQIWKLKREYKEVGRQRERTGLIERKRECRVCVCVCGIMKDNPDATLNLLMLAGGI